MRAQLRRDPRSLLQLTSRTYSAGSLSSMGPPAICFYEHHTASPSKWLAGLLNEGAWKHFVTEITVCQDYGSAFGSSASGMDNLRVMRDIQAAHNKSLQAFIRQERTTSGLDIDMYLRNKKTRSASILYTLLEEVLKQYYTDKSAEVLAGQLISWDPDRTKLWDAVLENKMKFTNTEAPIDFSVQPGWEKTVQFSKILDPRAFTWRNARMGESLIEAYMKSGRVIGLLGLAHFNEDLGEECVYAGKNSVQAYLNDAGVPSVGMYVVDSGRCPVSHDDEILFGHALESPGHIPDVDGMAKKLMVVDVAKSKGNPVSYLKEYTQIVEERFQRERKANPDIEPLEKTVFSR